MEAAGVRLYHLVEGKTGEEDTKTKTYPKILVTNHPLPVGLGRDVVFCSARPASFGTDNFISGRGSNIVRRTEVTQAKKRLTKKPPERECADIVKYDQMKQARKTI